MINILLSVRRPFSGFIIDGEKKWELRKNAPRIPRGEHVTLWLYESGKDGKRAIIGKCRLVVTASLFLYPPKGLLDLAIKNACVTEEHLRNYLPCCVWKVTAPVKLPAAVPLSVIGLTRPPLSWQYISPEQAVILEKAASLTSKMCVECQLWSGWDGCCMSLASGHLWEEMPSDHPACDDFKPEEIEQEEEDDA